MHSFHFFGASCRKRLGPATLKWALQKQLFWFWVVPVSFASHFQMPNLITVEVPANALSSLDKYLGEQIAGSCLVIPLLLGTVSAPSTFFPVFYGNKFKNRSGIGTFLPPKGEVSFFFLFVCVDLMMFSVSFQITWWFQGWNAVKKASAEVSNFHNWMTSKRQFPAAV